MIEKSSTTFWARVYIAGPIEVAKQIIRRECMAEGLCVTISPTCFIYTGGEEAGYVVGFNNYPRFPDQPGNIKLRAMKLASILREETFQHSVMVQFPDETIWVSARGISE